jgi:hypothetical protein
MATQITDLGGHSNPSPNWVYFFPGSLWPFAAKASP